MSIESAYRVVGLMSGTSLDGLDLAYCTFRKSSHWEYSIEAAETLPYDEHWHTLLSGLHLVSGETLVRNHVAYGNFLGERVREFLLRHSLQADFIASHGHTVFHQPSAGFTFQAGCGSSLAARAGLPVVYDFRTSDVALGGQGAPLVPVGDRLLFPTYDACLNLGGIANISFERKGDRIAFDVAPCNLLLNALARMAGKAFDHEGSMAAKGSVQPELLEKLDRVEYYRLPFPKSLGREDVEREFMPLLTEQWTVEDRLATVCRHLARQVAASLKAADSSKSMLVSGGGALHRQLIGELVSLCPSQIAVGTPELIHFKEALVFAFLGVLRMRGEVNVFRSVTGAEWDHVSGSIALP